MPASAEADQLHLLDGGLRSVYLPCAPPMTACHASVKKRRPLPMWRRTAFLRLLHAEGPLTGRKNSPRRDKTPAPCYNNAISIGRRKRCRQRKCGPPSRRLFFFVLVGCFAKSVSFWFEKSALQKPFSFGLGSCRAKACSLLLRQRTNNRIHRRGEIRRNAAGCQRLHVEGGGLQLLAKVRSSDHAAGGGGYA